MREQRCMRSREPVLCRPLNVGRCKRPWPAVRLRARLRQRRSRRAPPCARDLVVFGRRYRRLAIATLPFQQTTNARPAEDPTISFGRMPALSPIAAANVRYRPDVSALPDEGKSTVSGLLE